MWKVLQGTVKNRQTNPTKMGKRGALGVKTVKGGQRKQQNSRKGAGPELGAQEASGKAEPWEAVGYHKVSLRGGEEGRCWVRRGAAGHPLLSSWCLGACGCTIPRPVRPRSHLGGDGWTWVAGDHHYKHAGFQARGKSTASRGKSCGPFGHRCV